MLLNLIIDFYANKTLSASAPKIRQLESLVLHSTMKKTKIFLSVIKQSEEDDDEEEKIILFSLPSHIELHFSFIYQEAFTDGF